MKKIIIFLPLIAGAIQRPQNLAVAKSIVQDYYESCYYEKEVGVVVDRAFSYFKKHVYEPGAVVIFDIDDTLLSDYCEMKQVSFGFVPKLNHEWILKAVARAVPHVKRLYDYFLRQGYSIVLLSGRKENERDATIKNLLQEGFSGFKQLILRTPQEERLTACLYKSQQRRELVKQGAHIVACVGDQWSDLTGGNTGYQVKIPNYTYVIE